ncbi:NYN domain-containing protein [Kribbella sp. NPDC051770]|uniref:NYN domain-containing protein n=1 Tax=Kribbella sp. NPDC051770 TaxID=3155413 RepID=UPI003434A6DD
MTSDPKPPTTPTFQAPDFTSAVEADAADQERSAASAEQNSPASSGTRPLLVVDAANVIGSRPDGWWKDRAGAARRLLTNLAAYHQTEGAETDIAVILEGAARPAADAIPTTPTLQVVLAPHSGDDTIVDVVADAFAQTPNREVTVVTADRGLRARVEPLGARTTGPNTLYALIDPK